MSSGPYTDKPELMISIPADRVVEWYVENDHERYKALSTCGVPAREEAKFDSRTGARSITFIPTHAVVCVVLEVPFKELERTTNALRSSRKIRPSAPYLMKAAEAANGAAEVRDRAASYELENKMLRKLLMELGLVLNCYDHGQPKLAAASVTGTPGPKRWVRYIESRLNEIKRAASSELSNVRAMLDEKRASVAAQLLSQQPDGDW